MRTKLLMRRQSRIAPAAFAKGPTISARVWYCCAREGVADLVGCCENEDERAAADAEDIAIPPPLLFASGEGVRRVAPLGMTPPPPPPLCVVSVLLPLLLLLLLGEALRRDEDEPALAALDEEGELEAFEGVDGEWCSLLL